MNSVRFSIVTFILVSIRAVWDRGSKDISILVFDDHSQTSEGKLFILWYFKDDLGTGL